MSVEAIKSANIGFEGKKAKKETKKNGFAKAITKPIKDDFKKTYDGAKPTPALIADYSADKLIKGAVATLGMVFLFAKAKNMTNGLTAAARKSFHGTSGFGAKLGEITAAIKKNNADFVTKGQEIAAEAKAEGVTIKDKIIKIGKNIAKSKEGITEFNHEGKLGKAVQKVFGKNAVKVENGLLKAGIAGGSDLVDTAVAATATAIAGSGLLNVTDEVTKADNDDLAKSSTKQHIRESLKTVGKLAETAQLLGV